MMGRSTLCGLPHDPESPYARTRRPAQCRHHRPRRPRQDHLGGRHAVAIRSLPGEPGREHPGHGLDGPGAGEGHHDPGQEHRGRSCPGRWFHGHDQHHRHPRPRRFRRRGRARSGDGGRGAAAGRRLRGAAAADPLRAAQGAGQEPADHRGDQQGRSSRCPDRRGRRRGLRAVHGPGRRCRRPPPGLPDHLLRGEGGPGLADPAGGQHPARFGKPRTAVRADHEHHPRPAVHRGRAAAGPCHQPGRLPLFGPAGAVPDRRGHAHPRPDCGLVPSRRLGAKCPALGAADHQSAGAGPGRLRRSRRHRGDRRHPGDHHRRDPGRPERSPSAAADHRGRTVDLDDHRDQHLAAGRQGRQAAHRPTGQEPAGHRADRQCVDPGAEHRPSRHLGGAGPRRAAAGRAGGDDAPRRLRADRRQARGADPQH